jgi:hypothetical protein
MTKSLFTGIVVCVALAVFAGNANAYKAHTHKTHKAHTHKTYIMNGEFDWRRQRPGWEMPWYSHGYSNGCVAWTPHGYHYECDPNGRY